MKVTKVNILKAKHPWLESFMLNRTARWYQVVLKYIRRAHFDEGEEENMMPRVCEFEVPHTGEKLTHTTTITVFYNLPKSAFPFMREAGVRKQELLPIQSVYQVLRRLREDEKVVDAIVIQTIIRSSKLGDLAETIEIVIPEGSTVQD